MNYRAEIDGLRALAVVPVILFHAGFDWFKGGYVGVDIFFVISGYLITTIIISEMTDGKFSIVNFYERRARRLLPALFFVMTACLPFAWLWLSPNDLKEFGQSLVAVSTFSSNILFWLQSGYFDTAAELKPLLHTWSLAVEEQYYIIFPVFLMLTWKLGIKWILILLTIAFFISIGIAQWGAYNSPPAAFYLLPTRGWELLIGVFAAIYLKYNVHIKSIYINQILSLVGFTMIMFSIIVFDKTTPFPSFYTLVPTIGTLLLILCSVPKTFIHRLLTLKFLVGIGLISYSAYLWHQPILAFAKNRALFIDDLSNIWLISLCLLSFMLAWISWKFIEKPFRNKQKIKRQKIFLYSLIFISIYISIGQFINFNHGFKNRFPDLHTTANIAMYDEKGNCFGRSEGFCNLTDSRKKIFVVGDSTTEAIAHSLNNIATEFAIVPISAPHCILIENYDLVKRNIKQKNCTAEVAAYKIKILEMSDSPIIIYGGMFSSALTGKSVTSFERKKTSEKSFEPSGKNLPGLENSLKETIYKLAAIKNSQVFVIESFEYGVNAARANFLGYSNEELQIKKSKLEELHIAGNKMINSMNVADNITIINSLQYFCKDSFCYPVSTNGELFFEDGVHPTPTLANLLAVQIVNEIEDVSRVFNDISSKLPTTIEWE